MVGKQTLVREDVRPMRRPGRGSSPTAGAARATIRSWRTRCVATFAMKNAKGTATTTSVMVTSAAMTTVRRMIVR